MWSNTVAPAWIMAAPARLLMPSSSRVELNTLEATTVPAVVEAVASDIRAPEMGASR